VNAVFVALSRCRRALPERDRWRIAGVIHRESERHGYDPLFVLAMADVESACSPTARSPKGAVGLIQVHPTTVRVVAATAGPHDARMLTTPSFNVQVGLRYLAQLERRFGDPYLAMAAYNLGPSRVARMPRHHARRAEYVRKVLSRYQELLAQQAMDVARGDS
jgi:soluble lytic murein transglycosylase-like protein